MQYAACCCIDKNDIRTSRSLLHGCRLDAQTGATFVVTISCGCCPQHPMFLTPANVSFLTDLKLKMPPQGLSTTLAPPGHVSGLIACKRVIASYTCWVRKATRQAVYSSYIYPRVYGNVGAMSVSRDEHVPLRPVLAGKRHRTWPHQTDQVLFTFFMYISFLCPVLESELHGTIRNGSRATGALGIQGTHLGKQFVNSCCHAAIISISRRITRQDTLAAYGSRYNQRAGVW